MKNPLPILVPVIAVIVALIGFGWAANFMQTPAQELQTLMEPELETAQRILANYSPDSGFLADAFNRDELADMDPEAALPPEVQAVLDSLDQLASEHDQALRGAPPYDWRQKHPSDLSGKLKTESEALNEAFTAVNTALGMTAGSGANAVSGRSHPVATQLKATLLYERADLLRRQAAYELDIAEKARHDFRAEYTLWRETDAKVRSLEHRLRGGPPPEVSSALDDSAATESPSDTATASPPPSGAARDEGASLTPERLLTIDERKTQVAQQLAAIEPAIAVSQAAVAELEQKVAAVRARLDEAVRTKKEAQARMFAIDEQKLDPLDAGALERFTTEYESAAETYRKAERDSQLFEHGGYENARISTDDEEKMLTAPLEPSQPGTGLIRFEGLNALQNELQAAKDVLQAEVTLRDELVGQNAALDQEGKDIQDELDTCAGLRSKQRDNALVHARVAMKHAVNAFNLEAEALEICTESGPAAVSTAQSAASTAVRDIGEFMRSQPPVSGANPRLDFLPQYTALLEADLAYLQARIEAQRSRFLENHADLLARSEQMGMEPSSLLGEGMNLPEIDPALVGREAAREGADDAHERMQATANDALNRLEDAQGLTEKWFVGAARAAVQYLLAQNARTREEAEARRQEALDLYRRIPKEASDFQRFQPVIEGLSSTQP